MSDLIKRHDAIKELSKVFADCEPCDKEEASDIAVTTIKELPSAEPQGDYNRGYCDAVQGIADEMVKQGKHIEQNRPKGDVDAVAILMREMHNLEQGYITIGEFDERIEPLSHLCYGRPQGEWTQNALRPDIHRYECSNCKAHHIARYDYCPSCGARMKGADNE